jgi:hypothetical protein
MTRPESHDLVRVREAFEHWRSERSGRGRIPDRLWRAAVVLLETQAPSTVCRALRLSATELKKRRQMLAAGSTAARQAPPAFVELRLVGLDTETKPPFINWEAGEGQHVVQLATRDHVFVFSIDHRGGRRLIRDVLEAEHITKVGFGLASDCKLLARKLGVTVRPKVELSVAVGRLGYRDRIGLQAAVAIMLGLYLEKPLNMTRSDWARKWLSSKQLRYAADDASAALRVYHALEQYELKLPKQSERIGARTSPGRRNSPLVDTIRVARARGFGSSPRAPSTSRDGSAPRTS